MSFYGFKANDRQLEEKGLPLPGKSSAEVDAGTTNRIQELEAKKRRAVEDENFDLAKDIKAEIDRLKSVAVQISRLEERKQEAIRRENYDDAKVINEEIKRLRQGQGQQMPIKEVKPSPIVEQNYYKEQDYGSSVSPKTQSRQQPVANRVPQPLQEKPKQAYKPPPTAMSYDDDERPLNNKNPNPYGSTAQYD